jgi:hypothetical protein
VDSNIPTEWEHRFKTLIGNNHRKQFLYHKIPVVVYRIDYVWVVR